MFKVFGLLSVVFSIVLFNSCFNPDSSLSTDIKRGKITSSVPEVHNTIYGSYLAGREAIHNGDYHNSVRFLTKANQLDSDNKDIANQLYVSLLANGDVKSAAKYAQLLTDEEKTKTAYIVMAVNDIMEQKYDEALINTHNRKYIFDGIQYIMEAWIYAGKNMQKEAFASLEKAKNKELISDYYLLNKAKLYEYFKQTKQAQNIYEKLSSDDEKIVAGFRNFQTYRTIMEFYMHNGMKEKAQIFNRKAKFVAEKIKDSFSDDLFNNPNYQYSSITPQTAVADVMLYISSLIDMLKISPELSFLFNRLAEYSNPNDEFLKIGIAMHLSAFGFVDDAIKYFEQIKPSSYFYYPVQVEIVTLYSNKQNYNKAEKIIYDLKQQNPEDTTLYFLLGDILYKQKKYNDVFNMYNDLSKSNPRKYIKDWKLLYSMGAACERAGNWPRAEIYLSRAMDLNPNNYILQNYLGYSWISRGENIDKAFELIAKAYSKQPFDAHIIDSLGWAFYKLGKIENAIKYLELAVKINPANALINEHLGDAYWFGERKNEAKFQWNHASVLHEDAEEVDMDTLKDKIQNGISYSLPDLSYNEEAVEKLIKEYNL